MDGHDLFDPDPASSDFTHSEGLAQAPILDSDDKALENLDPFLVAFQDFLVHPDGVAYGDGLIFIKHVLRHKAHIITQLKTKMQSQIKFNQKQWLGSQLASERSC